MSDGVSDLPKTNRAEAAKRRAVAIDLPCKQCGYNLRGLAQRGQCPECAADVALSLRGDFLRFCSPEWLARVTWGVTIMLVIIPFGLLVFIVSFVLLVQRQPPIFGQAAQLATALLWTCGTWLLTSPPPDRTGDDPDATLRTVTRTAGILGPAVIAMPALRPLATQLVPAPFFWSLVGLCWAAVAIGELAKLAIYERLARRIPSRLLTNDAHLLLQIFKALLGGTALLLGLVGLITFAGSNTILLTAVASLGPLLFCIFVAFLVASLFILRRLRLKLIAQLTVARRNWRKSASRHVAST